MKPQLNEIKRMQRLAGLITEGEYQESLPKGSSFSSSKLVDTLKNYIETNSLGLENIDDEPKYVHFEFTEDQRKEADQFEEFLLASMLSFKRSKERDGGYLVYMFDVDKKQIKQQLGLEQEKTTSSNNLVSKLKQYMINYSSTRLEDIDNDSKRVIYFEFFDEEKEADRFEEFLTSSMLSFKRSKGTEGGYIVSKFSVDKEQIKQQLGL